MSDTPNEELLSALSALLKQGGSGKTPQQDPPPAEPVEDFLSRLEKLEMKANGR